MTEKDMFISELENQKRKEEQALRYNDGKLRWSLIDRESLEEMVKVLEIGSEKYDDHNWKKGLPFTEVSESLLRHMFAFMKGEDNDKESGKLHLAHVMCNAMFLIYMHREKPEFDNRLICEKTK